MESPEEDIITNAKYILDPLSVIIKLAILSKKKIGTKVSVYNNVLFIQEVGIFQSLVRYVFKSNKIDIQYLYNPIEIACNYFLSEQFVRITPNIKNLFIDAQKGIKSLIETYKTFTIITHTLYMYYNIISNYLGDRYNKNLFIKDTISELYNKELINKLNSIWNADRIKIVLNMIEYINKGDENSIKCLEEFMIIIDDKMRKLL
jgi:uncharacterized protein YqgQ